jgi:uncharacterized protein (TIGR03086 family)
VNELELLQRVVEETTTVIAAVPAGQLSNPSPCEGWTVRDVINHIVGGATVFAISVEQGSVPDDDLARLFGGDNVGDDALGAWKTASNRALAAFGLPGALEQTVKLPFGEMPGAVALSIAIFDVLTHAVDIAWSTGQHLGDTELLETALVMGEQMVTPELRVPGVFDPAQPAPEGASGEVRLLAFAGRKVA